MQWGRSNVVDPAEWPKIGLLNRGFARMLLFFLRPNRENLLKSVFRDWSRSVELWLLDGAKNLMHSKNEVVYKLHAGWFINRTPLQFINPGLFIKFKGLLWKSYRKKGKFNTECLAVRQFISPTQAP